MLKWLNELYIGEGIKKPDAFQSKISAGAFVPGVYLVTLSETPGNIIEIIPAAMLVQQAAYDRCPMIIGMAMGKDHAIDLTVNILKHVYKKTGAFQVEEYLKNR